MGELLLEGLRVLDLSLWQPGQTATKLLADLGADVLKVEPPGGDRMRPLPDRFAASNGHKRSVVLDLTLEADHARLLDLVRDAEVLVESFRPAAAARLGVTFDELRAVNPAIVVCSITGFGGSGPLAGLPGHERSFQAYAGAFTFPETGPPMATSMLVGDQGAGTAAAFAILAAVIGARRTGEGEHIDVSITDILAAWVAPAGPLDPTAPSGPGWDELPALGTFATADGGWVELGVYTEDQGWDALCRGLALSHLVGLDLAERTAQAAALRAELASAIGARRRDELVADLTAGGIAIAPVLTRDEMLDHPAFRHLFPIGPDGWRTVAHPIRYAVHPARPPGPAPALPDPERRRG